MDMGLLKAANSTPLAWVDVEKTPYPSGYQPVMALAENHIHFLNVPGTPVGDVDIFVIHCQSHAQGLIPDANMISSPVNYFQPDPQPFPTPNGTFPATYGQTASFFLDSGVRAELFTFSVVNKSYPTNQVQEAFAFIPSDGSATYVLNVDTNTTQILAGPTTKDAAATYYASTNSLIQLDSQGDVSYLPFNPNDTTANAAAQWSKVMSLATAAPPSAANSNPSSSASSDSPKASPSLGSSKSSNNNSNGASALAPRSIIGAILGAAVLGVGALLL